MNAIHFDNTQTKDLFTWSEDLKIGIEEIDAQHKVLVDLINELNRAIHERHGSEAALNVLDRLVEYTSVHFALEECLMRILGYPDYENHKTHHAMLLKQVTDLHQKVKDGLPVSFELLHFLKNWLTKHILEEDKGYVPHMKSRGIVTSYKKSSWLDRIFHINE